LGSIPPRLRPWNSYGANLEDDESIRLFPRIMETRGEGPVRRRERLGELLRHYHQEAA
jgi:hypothetical protein